MANSNSTAGNTLQMIDTPRTVDLLWNSNAPNCVAGLWQVTDNPTGKPLLTGISNASSQPGQTSQFSINFTKIESSYFQITRGSSKHFYVRIVPLNSHNQAIGLPSQLIDVLFLKQA
jgi:hypothetical protein